MKCAYFDSVFQAFAFDSKRIINSVFYVELLICVCTVECYCTVLLVERLSEFNVI